MLGVRTKEWKHCKFSTNIVDIDTHPDIDSKHKAATDSLVCLNCQLWWFLHALVTDFRHDSLVMVSGGSGIAPFISIIREILFQGSKQKPEIPSILLVCAFRNSADLAMLELLLPHFSQPHRNFSKHKAADRSLRHKRRRAAEDRSKYPSHMVQTWPIWLTHYSSHWPEQLALAWCNNHIFIFYVSSVVGYHHPLSYLPDRSQHWYDLPFFL